MAEYDLGKVVGDPGEKGDSGSSVWNTSTAPTYANSKYTFNISNLSGKAGLEIAVNDIIFYSTYYYIVSTVNSTTVDCSTRVSIKGSDASVTIVDNLTSTSSTSALSAKQGKVLNDNKIETSAIVTSFGSPLSDSKVASEKLVKNSLDGKQATLVSGTNIKTINNNSLLGSGNIDIQGSSVDIVTSWETTPSDSKVASEKLTKDTLDTKANSSSLSTVATSGSYADLSNKPTIPTKISDLQNDSDFIETSSTAGLVKNDGTIMTSGTGSSNWAVGNHTHSDYVSATKVTSWSSTVSDSNVPSEKLVKDSLDSKLDDNLSSSSKVVDYALGDFVVIADYSDGFKIKRTFNLLTPFIIDTTAHSNIGSSANDNQSVINGLIDAALGNKISKSSISGLVKNDGTIDTTAYSTFDGDYDSLSNKPTIPSKTSDLTNDGADGTNVFVANNDSRLSDARTPTSHTHGNLTNDGKVGSTANYFVYTTTSGAITSKQKIGNITTSGAIGSTANKPLITTTNGVITTGSFGTSANSFCEGNDSRLSDARTPTAHTHTVSNITDFPTIPSSSSDLSDGSSLVKKSSTSGLIKNDGTIDTTSYSTFSGDYDDLTDKPTIPSKISDLTNDSDFIETSSTTGLVKNDGTIDTNTYLTSSALTNYVQKSSTTGLLKNDGTIDTSAYITSSALSNYIQKSNTSGLIKNDGTIDTTQYLSSLPSHNHDVSQIIDPNGHMFIGSSEDASQGTINTLIDEGFSDVFGILSHKISTSSTVGLIKNDGSVDTNTYLTSSAISGMLTTSDVANNLTTTTSGKVLDARQGKALADLIGDAITYINQ